MLQAMNMHPLTHPLTQPTLPTTYYNALDGLSGTSISPVALALIGAGVGYFTAKKKKKFSRALIGGAAGFLVSMVV